MATDLETVTENLRQLSEAEAFARTYYEYVSGLASYAAAPAWLVKRYNAYADTVNSDIIFVTSLRQKYLADPRQPILVPRLVLADGSEVTTADDVLLGDADLAVLNISRSDIVTDENTGVPRMSGAPGQLGALPWYWGVVIVIGALKFAAPEISRMLSNLPFGGAGERQRLITLEAINRYKFEAKKFTAIEKYFKDCIGSAQDWVSCARAMPEALRSPTAPPKLPKEGMGIWEWVLTVGAVSVVGLGAIWLFRRALKKPEAGLEVVPYRTPTMQGVRAFSKERYRASASERRMYGGATVTEFYVYRDEDENNPSAWKIITGYGRTPGERKTDAIRRSGLAGLSRRAA